MRDARIDGALKEEIDQQGKTREQVTCRVCRSDRVYRLNRKGILQTWVYPLFGFYPWRCKACASNMKLRQRYETTRNARAR